MSKRYKRKKRKKSKLEMSIDDDPEDLPDFLLSEVELRMYVESMKLDRKRKI